MCVWRGWGWAPASEGVARTVSTWEPYSLRVFLAGSVSRRPRRPAPTFLPWTLFSGPRSSLLLPVLPAPGGHPEAPAPPPLATTGVVRGRSGVARTREAAAPGTGAGRRAGAGSGPRRGAGPGAGTCAPGGAGPLRGLGRAPPRTRRERLSKAGPRTRGGALESART